MQITRSFLMKVHLILAVFLLPVAVMFFVTGALYIWEIKGEEEKSKYQIVLEAPFSGSLDDFTTLTSQQLSDLGLSVPTGTPKIKQKEEGDMFEWSGSALNVTVKIDVKTSVAEMEVKQSSWYRHLVQLHKAKGGLLFKVYATVLSIALLIVLLTGFIMAWQVPRLRYLTVMSISSGLAIFLVLVVSS